MVNCRYLQVPALLFSRNRYPRRLSDGARDITAVFCAKLQIHGKFFS